MKLLDTNVFGNKLDSLGYNFFCGVPCSYLTFFINYLINKNSFVMSHNEGDAVATCAGAYLGGRKPIVLMQNSGLTNAITALTSLNYPFKIPVLGFVSLRGEPGNNDEPQHELMGVITEKLLDLMQIRWEYLSTDEEIAAQQLIEADEVINSNHTFFFIVKNKTFSSVELKNCSVRETRPQIFVTQKAKRDIELPSRKHVLEVINQNKNTKTILLATTGFTGRELSEVEDSLNNLYMVGSMGCISSFALGLALTRPNKDIIAIDGDGALLMRMGNLATNGYYSPDNMLHILLDNNMHDSTGGQFTVSHNVDFVQIAASAGYKESKYVHSLEEMDECLKSWQKNKVLTFLCIKIKREVNAKLSRPKVKPFEIKDRLKKYISGQGL
ncbi:MAG: phosphonopyruvate decarboxylase [Candidatus Margulisbacteria bacterium]|nr:phosphonopyruvate decarboxylase [Candidatus Margulisiibacteriota bacterium]